MKLMMTATVMTKRAKILKLDLKLTKLYHHNYDFHWQNFQGIASLLWFYSPRPTRYNSGENLMGKIFHSCSTDFDRFPSAESFEAALARMRTIMVSC